jgi:hypothetical protein
MPPGLRIARAWLVACALFVVLGIAAGSASAWRMDARPDPRCGLVRTLALTTLALEPAALRTRPPQGAPGIDRRFTPVLPGPGASAEGPGGEP